MACAYRCSVCGHVNTSCDIEFCSTCGADFNNDMTEDIGMPDPKEVLDPE